MGAVAPDEATDGLVVESQPSRLASRDGHQVDVLHVTADAAANEGDVVTVRREGRVDVAEPPLRRHRQPPDLGLGGAVDQVDGPWPGVADLPRRRDPTSVGRPGKAARHAARRLGQDPRRPSQDRSDRQLVAFLAPTPGSDLPSVRRPARRALADLVGVEDPRVRFVLELDPDLPPRPAMRFNRGWTSQSPMRKSLSACMSL